MANTVGTRIAENRKKMGITQEQLAEAMGVSFQAVSKWENDFSCPDITLLPGLADYFHITIDELLRGQTNKVVQIDPQNKPDMNKLIMKICVDSADGDHIRVNLPLSLIKMGLEIGMQVPQISGNETLKNLDFEAILRAAESGVIGKIVEVRSAEGDIVDIVIE